MGISCPETDKSGEAQEEKIKGCDIGYALAACSREGANSVDACTVTAFDVITAFAVPNSNFSLRSGRFSGARQVALPSKSLSLLRIGKILFKPNLFSRRRVQS